MEGILDILARDSTIGILNLSYCVHCGTEQGCANLGKTFCLAEKRMGLPERIKIVKAVAYFIT